MIGCPKCGTDKMWHYQNTDECDICGTHPCEIECTKCDWKGSFDDLSSNIKETTKMLKIGH